jgi:hypothetical protein
MYGQELNKFIKEIDILSLQYGGKYKVVYDNLSQHILNDNKTNEIIPKLINKGYMSGGNKCHANKNITCDMLRGEIPCSERKQDLLLFYEDIKNETKKYDNMAIKYFSDYIACCGDYYTKTINKYEFDKFVCPNLELIHKNCKYKKMAKLCLLELLLNDKKLQHDEIVKKIIDTMKGGSNKLYDYILYDNTSYDNCESLSLSDLGYK